MFLNEKSILFILLLNIVLGQVLQDVPQTSQETATENIIENKNKQICACLHNGECYSTIFDTQIIQDKKQQNYCRCPLPYIGNYCQYEAVQLFNQKQTIQKINSHEYQYFYYEPFQENMYSFNFKLCIDDLTEGQIVEEQPKNDVITFFITAENQYGAFQTDQMITQATTVLFQQNQCKQISIDYTVLLITKLKTIQKIILAVKLGDKINFDQTKSDVNKQKQITNIKTVEKEIKKRQPSENQVPQNQFNPNNTLNQDSDSSQKSLDEKNTDYQAISYNIYSVQKKKNIFTEQDTSKKDSFKNINDILSNSPQKLKEKDDSYLYKSLTITLSAYPFMVEFVVFNILFSLTTLVAFVIVGVIIFIIRSRILGISISSIFGMNSRLMNDLKHFNRYLPQQKFIKKQRKQGDISPNSSQIQCAICLVKFQEMDSIRKTPCFHSFHKSCIDSWCYENLTCPMCRKSLTEKNLSECQNSTALQLKNSPQSDE